jgi:uncharacterized protein (DUF2235 family)
MKRLVICCDGTWSSLDKTMRGMPVKTNVAKIANAVVETSGGLSQVMYYEPGIGTTGNWLRRLIDGITGNGLTDNILNAYLYLIQNYEIGDELYFFGFSRGAYTVRALSGLIRSCGILRRNAIDKINDAFKLYNSRTLTSHPNQPEAILFRRSNAVSDTIPIKFIGVWDTVGTLGNPLLFNGIFSKRHSFAT